MTTTADLQALMAQTSTPTLMQAVARLLHQSRNAEEDQALALTIAELAAREPSFATAIREAILS